MARKKKPRIEVQTVPTGYSLTINGEQYMYFTPEKLMEGVMVHIGLHMTEQLSPDMIKSFIDSALEWNDLKKSTKEINRLKTELEIQKRKYNGLARKLCDERAERVSLIELARDVCVGRHGLTDAIARMHAAINRKGKLKRLSLKDMGISSNAIIDKAYGAEETDE